MIAQTRGSEQIVEVQGAVTFCPRLDEIHHCVVEDVLTGVVAPLTTVDAEPEEVAVRSHGEHLVADGLWLRFDDSDPRGTALEADHGLIQRHVAAGLVELEEERLALVVEEVGLLHDGLSLTARDRGCDMEVAVELTEAVPRHEGSAVGVAVALLPVVVKVREVRRTTMPWRIRIAKYRHISSVVTGTQSTAWREMAYRFVLVTKESMTTWSMKH